MMMMMKGGLCKAVLLCLPYLSLTLQKPAGPSEGEHPRASFSSSPSLLATRPSLQKQNSRRVLSESITPPLPALSSLLDNAGASTGDEGSKASRPCVHPPTEEGVKELSVPALVRMNTCGFCFACSESVHWIQAFSSHPDIIALDADNPSSEEYARRYHDLYEADTNSSEGKKLSHAIQRHMEVQNMNQDYRDSVMKYLRNARKQYTARHYRHKIIDVVGYDVYKIFVSRSGDSVKKKQAQKAEEKDRFEQYLIGEAITAKNPQSVEEQTRHFTERYYEGDKRTASNDMMNYMNLCKMDKNGIKEARATRTDYNRKIGIKEGNDMRQRRKELAAMHGVTLDQEERGGRGRRRGKEVEEVSDVAFNMPFEAYAYQMPLLAHRSSSPVSSEDGSPVRLQEPGQGAVPGYHNVYEAPQEGVMPAAMYCDAPGYSPYHHTPSLDQSWDYAGPSTHAPASSLIVEQHPHRHGQADIDYSWDYAQQLAHIDSMLRLAPFYSKERGTKHTRAPQSSSLHSPPWSHAAERYPSLSSQHSQSGHQSRPHAYF
jgi:hypothetical protein